MKNVDKAREKEIKRAFGARVRFTRKSKGLSQETLAMMCELDRTYIGSVERGERSCPGAWCKSVALYAAPGG